MDSSARRGGWIVGDWWFLFSQLELMNEDKGPGKTGTSSLNV